MGVRRLVAVCLALAALLSGCGGAPQEGALAATLPWSTGITLGREPGGAAVGPLAAAAGDGVTALADSFAGRVLLWRHGQGGWSGPTVWRVPTAAALVAVALPPGADGGLAAVAADAAGGIWGLTAAGSTRELARLTGVPGELRTVAGLALTGSGIAVADVLEIGPERTRRDLWAVEPNGRTRLIAATPIAAAVRESAPVGGAAPLGPPGVRTGLATCPPAGVWLVARASSGSELVCLGLDGHVLHRRRWPRLRSPTDFLGVDRSGQAYALEGAGSASATLVRFGPAGTVQVVAALPGPNAPLLPHPAALSPGGAVLLLTAVAGGLRLVRAPAGPALSRAVGAAPAG